MIVRNILEVTKVSREVFEEEKTISNAMTWAYNVSRLVLVRKNPFFIESLTEETDAEISAYIQWKE